MYIMLLVLFTKFQFPIKIKTMSGLLDKAERTAHTKLEIYFGINSVLLIFYLYYTTAFCAVYCNSQISWLEGSVISVVIGLVQLFVTRGLLFILDRCARRTRLTFVLKAVNRLLE